MRKSVYTKPKLVKASSGWYVYFRYNNKLKRYKLGLNYIKNLNEREREGNALARVLLEKLQKGWNPLDKTEASLEIYFVDAIHFALEKKKENIAPKTYLGYKGSMKFIIKAIDDLMIRYLDITEVKRSHVRSVMERVKKNRKWSNKSYNKNLNYLKAVLSELLDWDIIETNPAHKIKNLPTEESRANIPATPEQHKIIKEHLESKFPNFFKFVLTIYHVGIRPKEILDIKLHMVNLVKKEIILPPEITKTNKERIVPINNHLLEHFMEMEIETYPSSFYLFGSYRPKGAGNRGKYIDFIPGHTKIKRDTATKRWHKIVKKGLGIDVNLYSLKHQGANDKIRAGIELDVLRELYGHSSSLMTMRYAKAIKEVYRNEIINKSPKF